MSHRCLIMAVTSAKSLVFLGVVVVKSFFGVGAQFLEGGSMFRPSVATRVRRKPFGWLILRTHRRHWHLVLSFKADRSMLVGLQGFIPTKGLIRSHCVRLTAWQSTKDIRSNQFKW